MIEELNNDYDLETIEVRGPFAVGDTGVFQHYDAKWRVRWRDETTLMIAPERSPEVWRPAHIYNRSRPHDIETWGDFWAFNLTPDRDQRLIMDAAGLIDRAHEKVIDICAERGDDAVWGGPLGEASKSLALACIGLEAALGFKIPRPTANARLKNRGWVIAYENDPILPRQHHRPNPRPSSDPGTHRGVRDR